MLGAERDFVNFSHEVSNPSPSEVLLTLLFGSREVKLLQDCLWTQGLEWTLLELRFRSRRLALWPPKAPEL